MSSIIHAKLSDDEKSDLNGCDASNKSIHSTAPLKAAILVGGPQKGTRFRPLSLQVPKPLFPIAGLPLIEHHIAQLYTIADLDEVFLLGCFPASEFGAFVADCAKRYPRVSVRYLQEPTPLGTAGGLLHFQHELLADKPRAVFVLNADICGDFPVVELVTELDSSSCSQAECLLLTTEATREQSVNFGSVALDPRDATDKQHISRILHYVDKPTTFVSTHISCGLYVLRPGMWDRWLTQAQPRQNGGGQSQNDGGNAAGGIWLETDVFPQMAAAGALYSFHNADRWWSQTKTPASVLYANRHYLRLFRERQPCRLSAAGVENGGATTTKNVCEIVDDVFIDPSAEVHPTATIGPNVSIGAGAKIGKGVRVRESIVLAEAVLEEHCCVLHSVIGWRSRVGPWARVEGSPIEPDPNVPFAKLENKPLFNAEDGRLNPSLSILGSEVTVQKETIVLNSVVLPFKELSMSYRNQIIL